MGSAQILSVNSAPSAAKFLIKTNARHATLFGLHNEHNGPFHNLGRRMAIKHPDNLSWSCEDTASTPQNERYASQAFLAAFQYAFRKEDGAACLQLVRSIMAASNGSQGQGDPDRSGSSKGQFTEDAVPAYSDGSRAYLYDILRTKHQGLMRMLLLAGNVEGALEYLFMLPPDKRLSSSLMKECIDARDLPSLRQVIQVRHIMCISHEKSP